MFLDVGSLVVLVLFARRPDSCAPILASQDAETDLMVLLFAVLVRESLRMSLCHSSQKPAEFSLVSKPFKSS